MKNKNKGFTLIEILAVIIILGILVIIAIPAVTKYIDNSRREAYIDTAKQIISSAKTYVNSDDELDVYDDEVTYYMPISCFKTENDKKSINGNFTVAYVGVVYKGDEFDYYWLSVDEEGEGIRVLTSYDDLDVDKIESGIELSDIDTSMSVGGTTKTQIFNNDCTEFEQGKGHILVSFDANGGEYSDGSRINTIKYSLPIEINEGYKVSHTSNIDDAGNKLSDYGHNWTNSNITGTERGDTSKAHVVTIPGATTLHVKITYGGESTSWDWACMWQGSHPTYTAANDYNSSITGKLGGGSYTSSSNTKEYDVSGDTVTFAFKSDGSGVGDGYGYYAVITDKNQSANSIDKGYEGVYLEPTRDDYLFDGWEYNGKVYKTFKELEPSGNITYKAKWIPYSILRFVPNGGYMYINGNSVSSQTDYKQKAGSTLSFNGIYRNTSTYSSGSYTTTFNSNGGSTTPSSVTSTRYYSYSYSFKNWQLVGDCDNFPSETSTSGTYTFPDSLGEMCTITPQWNSTYSGYFAYSITLPGAPIREGYVFKGWKSSSNNQIYAAGSSYTPTGNHTFTAQWEQFTPSTGTICRRATSLHTAVCYKNNSLGCNNYSTYSYGSTITYGNLGTSGSVPNPGDAFDCDVNGDGVFDSQKERFYYISTNGNNYVFLYYTNVVAGGQATQNGFSYANVMQNYIGPNVGYLQLPNVSEWPNTIPQGTSPRQIVSENGSTTTNNGSNNIQPFTYTTRAARLLTYQEAVSACGSSFSSFTNRRCNYFFENVGWYTNSSGSYGYWLETPSSDDSQLACIMNAYGTTGSAIGLNSKTNVSIGSEGIRPVIEINKTQVSY